MGMICIPTTSASAKLSAASRKKTLYFKMIPVSHVNWGLGFYQLNPICLQVSQVSPLRNAGFLQLENAHMLCPLRNCVTWASWLSLCLWFPSLLVSRSVLSTLILFFCCQLPAIPTRPNWINTDRFARISPAKYFDCLALAGYKHVFASTLHIAIHLKQFRLSILQ